MCDVCVFHATVFVVKLILEILETTRRNVSLIAQLFFFYEEGKGGENYGFVS